MSTLLVDPYGGLRGLAPRPKIAGACHDQRDVLFVALDEQKRERALDEEATVPPSQKSWFAFGGAPQKRRTFAVSVPEGAGPGSRLRVRAPTTGQDMTVTVPAGVEAGSLFDVPLPEPRLPSLGE